MSTYHNSKQKEKYTVQQLWLYTFCTFPSPTDHIISEQTFRVAKLYTHTHPLLNSSKSDQQFY